ncbi:MAG TPA: oxygenase MpaB family protein [Candidatus Binatia bacterium]|nr:oxygenase MpaB family protein [Candidatus Binatia bacterium]
MERFFAPESAIWSVDREMTLLLGGGRALLMQIAHPKIAAGVADHSRFATDPLGRLKQTMETMWSIVFDDLPRAQASLERLGRVHERVQGHIANGTAYSARDPELLLWVHATLVDSALVTYDRFVRPLSLELRRRYYDDSKKLGVLMGVPETTLPAALEDFERYMTTTIESEAISVGAPARTLARAILYPRPWFLQTVVPINVLITAGLLPPKLRRAYGLRWSGRRESVLRLVAGSTRAALPLVPRMIRVVPHARAAERLMGG